MALRTCRYPPCGKAFEPEKPSYWWCCYDHYLMDKERKGQPLYDVGYRDGYAAGYEAGRQHAGVPQSVFRAALQLCHPDRYQQTPLCAVATEVTRWLIEHREQAGEASKN
jgi:hypothetical protein